MPEIIVIFALDQLAVACFALFPGIVIRTSQESRVLNYTKYLFVVIIAFLHPRFEIRADIRRILGIQDHLDLAEICLDNSHVLAVLRGIQLDQLHIRLVHRLHKIIAKASAKQAGQHHRCRCRQYSFFH